MATPRASRTTSAGAERDRELIVLADGPWARHWYWRDDLEAMQAASRHVGHADTDPAGELRRYRPTDTHQPHPHNTERSGRVYRFGPAQDPAEAGHAAEQVAQAGAAVAAAVIPAPRRPLDDEIGERRHQRRTQHEQHEQHATESAEHAAEREGVLW